MPTKPDELKILEEGTKRAEDRLKAPTPNIWMSITTREPEKTKIEFGEKVEAYVQDVQSGQYEKLINGKKN